MPFSLTYSVQKHYLEADIHVVIAPGLELREAMQRWKEVARLSRENNRDKVLVNMTFDGFYDLETKFRLAKNASTIGWSHDLKLAVVITDPDHFERQLFTETAMTGMGYDMKLFMKPRAAKKWLLE